MQKPRCFQSAMNFLTAEIALSLFILLNSGVYAGSFDRNASYFKGKDYSTDDCTYTLSGTSGRIGEAASNQRFGVTMGGSCPRTTVSNVTWISILSGAGMAGSDFVKHLAALAVNAALIKKPKKRGKPGLSKNISSYNLVGLQYFNTFVLQKVAPLLPARAKQIGLRCNPNVNYKQ